MPLRKRGEYWHYRFAIDKQKFAGSTELLATEANRKAAKRFEKAQQKAVRNGTHSAIRDVTDGRTPFAVAAGEFISWCKDVEYRQKRNTAARIATSFASLVGFLRAVPVGELSAGDIERYKSHRIQINMVKDVTLRHDLHALSLFFQYAAKMKWREGNPAREVSIPSDADAVRIHVLSADEEERYFRAAFDVVDREGRRNLYDVARFMLNQGCRPEEIMAARKLDLDIEVAALVIPGGKSRAAKRTLHLTPDSLEILVARLQSPGIWLFPSERYTGRHITKLCGSHDRACRAAGVSFVLYDLRHTFGTRMATDGKTDPFTLASIMGHANLRTIMRYVHPTQDQQKEAMRKYAEAMRKGRLKLVK
jgi:integrase